MHMFQQVMYRPRQPDFECKPRYYSYRPVKGESIYGLVWEIYQFENVKMQDVKIGVLPDACADLMFIYTPNRVVAYVTGSATGYCYMSNMEQLEMLFGVRFCSGALGNLFRVSAMDVAGCMIEGQDALFQQTELLARIMDAGSFEARVNIIKEYLKQRIYSQYEVLPLVEYSVNYIISNYGNINVTNLAELTGYTNRYIRKVFDEYVGVSPKQLSEIVKMQWSYYLYNTSENVNLADLAAMCGYYDQTHMNKSYKKLTNSLLKNLPKLEEKETMNTVFY